MPNTFNPDDYLAKQATAQSPQNVAPQNAATTTGAQPASTGFNPDAYLASQPQAKLSAQSMPDLSQASPSIPDEFGPITAFAKGATDAIVPQGMLNRVVKNSNMLSPEAQKALDQGQAAIDQKVRDYPLSALLGTGTGIVGAGAMGMGASAAALPTVEKGLAWVTADKMSEAAARGFGELALLSGEGGMFAVANDNPNNFSDAAKSFLKGSSIAAALGLSVKGLSGLNEVLTAGAKVKGLKEVALAERKVGIMNEAVSRAETMAAEKASELDVTRSQLSRSQALLTAESSINERVSTLPNKINDLLDHHINDIHGTVLQKIDRYKDVPVNALPNFQEAIDKLEGAKVYTPQGIAQKDSALKLVRGLLSEAYLPGSSAEDQLINAYQAPKATVDRLYKQNSQFGDLLYNRDFASSAPAEVKQALRNLQTQNRNLVAGVDPTGELSQHLDFEHSLLNARQRDGFAQDAPDFFKQYAKDKNDPSVMAKWRKFERNLMPRDEVQNTYGKNEAFDAGFKPETMQNPDLKQKAQNIRDLINAEVDPATSDYAVLKEAKSTVPKLQEKITKLQADQEGGLLKLDNRNLQRDRSLFSLNEKQMSVPENAIEALLPDNLRRALNLRRTINEGLDSMKQAGDTIVGNPQFQSGLMMLQKATPGIIKSTARGVATRVPSMLGQTKSSSEP